MIKKRSVKSKAYLNVEFLQYRAILYGSTFVKLLDLRRNMFLFCIPFLPTSIFFNFSQSLGMSLIFLVESAASDNNAFGVSTALVARP